MVLLGGGRFLVSEVSLYLPTPPLPSYTLLPRGRVAPSIRSLSISLSLSFPCSLTHALCHALSDAHTRARTRTQARSLSLSLSFAPPHTSPPSPRLSYTRYRTPSLFHSHTHTLSLSLSSERPPALPPLHFF